MMSPPPEAIYWCYGKHQPELFEELMKLDPSLTYVHGLPEQLMESIDRNRVNLVIIDDWMDEGVKDPRVGHLFTKGRHDNISVIFLTQNLFLKGLRTISLNSEYMTCFKNVRDVSQFSHLAKQLCPHHTQFLMQAYADATQKPFSYLFLDLKTDTDEAFRYKANIFPRDDLHYSYTRDL